MKYQLELSREQIGVVAEALEFYSRFMAGQWEIPKLLEHNEFVLNGMDSDFWNIRNNAQDMLRLAKRTFFYKLAPNESYGIGSENLHESANVAYDFYRPIREQFSKEYQEENPEEAHWGVYDSPGLTYSKEGRVIPKIIEDDEK